MHLAGARDGGGRGFGQTEVTHLAGAHQVGHGAHGVFDGHGLVDAVLVIEVYLLNPQALEAGIAAGLDVLGPAVDAARGFIGRVARDAEFGGDKHILAAAGDGLADEQLVGVGAVHVGGVKEVEALVQRMVDGGDGFGVVAVAGVELAHAHAAEADGGDLRAVAAEGAGFGHGDGAF
jgi:hypothetical protein